MADLKARRAEARYARTTRAIAEREREHAALAAVARTMSDQPAATGADLLIARGQINLASQKIAAGRIDLDALRATRMTEKKRYRGSLGASMILKKAFED